MKTKPYLVTIALIFVVSSLLAQVENPKLLLKGTISNYPIEMEISESDYITGKISGKYKYLSQKSYLETKGNIYGSCLEIEEHYNGKKTGTFYLEIESGKLEGFWVSETKVLPVTLSIESGDVAMLKAQMPEDLHRFVNSAISGTYKTSFNYINDHFASEDNIHYEIGFSGGFMIIEEINKDSIRFELELICGPTYHFAAAEGIAVKNGDVYVYENDPYNYGESCKIVFRFGEKYVFASSDNSMACGFGARAYVDHELYKVKD